MLQILIFEQIKTLNPTPLKNHTAFVFKSLTTFLLLFIFNISFSQTKEDIFKITKDYDLEKIQELENKNFKK